MKKSKYIKINNIEYSVNMLPGDRRSISLRMISSIDIEVRYPRFLIKRTVIEYIYKKSKWISKKHDLLAAGEETGAGKGIFEGRMLFFLGKQYRVEISGTEIRILDNCIIISDISDINTLERWYKDKSEKAVTEFLEKYNWIIPNCKVKVKKQKTIWGSCNSKQNIYINSRISMCPQKVIEYIMWHEISHLRYMNHSSDFYRQLESYCPDYKIHKDWLKKHSLLLQI
ncbi:MAG: DUF45 domain-containing protein [Clostridiales bacterium]|nr:DUF45 domain-containing protein [Clostridiales bacterium]